MSGMAGDDIAARTMPLRPEDRFERICCDNTCLKEAWCWVLNEVKRCGCRHRPCAVVKLPQRRVFAVIVSFQRPSVIIRSLQYDMNSQYK